MHDGPQPTRNALLIGTSDGLGKALARQLLDRGWAVVGVSRSPGGPQAEHYRHVVVDVRSSDYGPAVDSVLADGPIDLCIYCAGIGDLFDAEQLRRETDTLRVNLLGLAETIERVLPKLLGQGHGTMVGLSSLADVFPGRHAPGYAASKVGMSYYLEGLASALGQRGVAIVNVRLGFVDTKMAKSPVKPFMLEVDTAAGRILQAVLAERPPRRVNIPQRAALMMWLLARYASTRRMLGGAKLRARWLRERKL
jgi:short-subunit dehydrogenase